MKIFKSSTIFLGLLLGYLVLLTFVRNNLYPIHFSSQNIFFLDLIGIRVDMPYGLFVFFGLVNLLLLWLIGKRFFEGYSSLIPSVIYAISPWSSYLVVAGSLYIYLSFLLLLVFYCVILIRAGRRFLGSILMTGAVSVAMYSSLLLFLLLPAIFVLVIILKVTPFISSKLLILLIILLLPILFFIYSNSQGFKNIMNNEIKIFEDPGLLNMVNRYQGAASQQGLGSLARLSENKYLFFSEYLLLKIAKQFVPSTYFTSQEKLLNFSFSPPLYLGFLIPLVFGLFQLLKYLNFKKVLLASSLLVIPSVLAKSMVDLNRLFIFMPVIILVTTFGLILLYEQRNRKKIAIIFAISILLVIFQFFVTISDIQIREKERFIRYSGNNYEIGKQ